MSGAEGKGTAPEQRCVAFEGEAAPQLAELLLRGWLVVGREGTCWTLERPAARPARPHQERASRQPKGAPRA
jgi:hypothetical protein